MATDTDPIVDNWYYHTDKGQKFMVVDTDPEADIIEIQHFDGDLEQLTFDEWQELDIELAEPPENWSGPIEVGESDDYGTEITDTTAEDWDESLSEIRDPNRERLYPEEEAPGEPEEPEEGLPE